MKAVSTVISTVVMVLIIIALTGTYYFFLSGNLETMEKAVRIPANGVSCTGTTATVELKNLGDLPINNSDRESMLGLFENDPGIIARWTFDDELGNEALDSSGNGKHGSIYGETVLLMHFDEGSGNPLDSTSYANHGDISGHEPTWQPSGYCKSGRCLEFDGIDDYVDIPDDDSLEGMDELTISAWIYPRAATRGTIIAKNSPYGLIFNDDRTIFGSVYTGSWTTANGGTALPLDTWSHVAVTYDGSDIVVFVDGTPDGTAPKTGTLSTSGSPLQIGYNTPVGLDYPFNGTIDEVSVYSKALSQPEIQAMHDAGRAKFAERESPGRIGYGMDFDGTDDYVDMGDQAVFDFTTLPMSVCLWLNTPSRDITTNERLISKGITGSNYGFILGLLASDDSIFWGDSAGFINTGSTFDDGNWHHVCGTFDGTLDVSGLSIYVDGYIQTVSSGGTFNGFSATSEPLLMGATSQDGSISSYYDGSLDEVIVWDKELTPAEIQAQLKPSCNCAGLTCQCGELTIMKTSGQGVFKPFFDNSEIPGGGSVVMTDYNCLSDTCGYRVISPGGSQDAFADCR